MSFPLQFLLETLVSSTLMPNARKKHSKKDASSADVLDLAYASLKKFRKVTREIGKLSTGQKLVGGLVLAAAGLAYLATREPDGAAKETATDTLAPAKAAKQAPPRKPRKHAPVSPKE